MQLLSTPVARRRIRPDSDADVSQIAFGTMRLRGTVGEAAAHLNELHDRGITTHHSSREYDAHELYLQALKRCERSATFEHIVKLSSPSFDGEQFDPAAINQLVHEELQTLGTDRLASVQWLFRTPDAQNVDRRLELLADQAEVIDACFSELIKRGDIADVSVFTYHPSFARPALEALPTTSLCDYLNLAETDNAQFLDDVVSFYAIRPLGAGAMTTSADEVARALEWPLLHPTVKTIVLSANSIEHVQSAVDAAGRTQPDVQRFWTEFEHARSTNQEELS